MLTVRADQLHLLAAPLEAKFLEDLFAMVRTAFPVAGPTGDAALRDGVIAAVRQADAWGMATERETAFAVWLLHRLGPTLQAAENPGLLEVLEAADLSGPEKVHLATRLLAARGID